jgi:hypothetical protein
MNTNRIILWVGIAGLLLGGRLASAATSAATGSAALSVRYGGIEASPVTTGILYDLVLPLSKLPTYDGTRAAPVTTLATWRQMAFELVRASLVPSALPSPEDLQTREQAASREQVIPLAILNYRYERARAGVARDSLFEVENGAITGIKANTLTTGRAFAATALYARTYRGADVAFRVDVNALYYSNDPRPVKRLEIDFADGRGLRAVPAQGVISVHYQTTGEKTVRVRLMLADGAALESGFLFDVVRLTTPSPTETWTLTATVPYAGVTATGEAYVYLGVGHTQLERPLVVSEGLDLDNSMNWPELYAMLDQEMLIDTLHALGYDAVVLNYDNSTTYIQANAMLVKRLLEEVSSRLPAGQQFVLVGASMGGLTTRYALTYMEAHAEPHHVRTLLTFDSPHNGANIPLGVQYWVAFFAGQSADAALFRDELNTPSPRQMLLAHYTSPPNAVSGADPLRAAFVSDLAALGNYPQTVRRVAIANGSGYQQGLDFGPGAQLIRWEYTSFLVDITGNVWALNNAGSLTIFRGLINMIWPLPDQSQTVTVQATTPWDNAPGGTSNSMAQLDRVDPGYGDIVALHPDHCFIPTISALGLNVTDPFYNIAADNALLSHTSFQTVYFPAANQEHVTITPESFWWFMGEALDSLPAPVVVIQPQEVGLKLSWPPVPMARTYRVELADSLEGPAQSVVMTTDTVFVDSLAGSERRAYRVVAKTP